MQAFLYQQASRGNNQGVHQLLEGKTDQAISTLQESLVQMKEALLHPTPTNSKSSEASVLSPVKRTESVLRDLEAKQTKSILCLLTLSNERPNFLNCIIGRMIFIILKITKKAINVLSDGLYGLTNSDTQQIT